MSNEQLRETISEALDQAFDTARADWADLKAQHEVRIGLEKKASYEAGRRDALKRADYSGGDIGAALTELQQFRTIFPQGPFQAHEVKTLLGRWLN